MKAMILGLCLAMCFVVPEVRIGKVRTGAVACDPPGCEQDQGQAQGQIQGQAQGQGQSQSVVVSPGIGAETQVVNPPAVDNEYARGHYEGRGELVTEDFFYLLGALEIRCFRYDSWWGDKINWHEVHKVFLRERDKILKEWKGFNVKYIVVRHPRSITGGMSLAAVYSMLTSSSGGTGGPMLGFTSVGEKDKFEIYFVKLTKEKGY